MGGILEIGKLVTAVWLHKYWKQAAWWLKSYLSIAVVVLMFITSMGIFGFLSKAHIEQTSAGEESVAQVQQIESEISRQRGLITRAEEKIVTLENSGTTQDTNVQSQIDKEQNRIDNAYTRIQPAIGEQNAIIANVTSLFQTELDKIDNELAILQGYVDNNEIKKAQQMIGASADGVFGKKTAEKIGDWKDAKQAERAEWLTKIQQSANSPTVQAARTEIQRLRGNADKQIAESNKLIDRLRSQLAQTDKADEVDANIDEQMLRIKTAETALDTLVEEKSALEGEYRKLEAEVGPIKYIAEFVYGEAADKNMLEEAVRWVIIIIIFVFDPLAVLLLIASQYTFEWRKNAKREDDGGERLRLERQEFERARAQAIVNNVPPTHDPIKAPTQEEAEVPVYKDVDQAILDTEFDDEFGDIEELRKQTIQPVTETEEETVEETVEGDRGEADWFDRKEDEDDEPHILDTPVDNTETEAEKARREDYDAKHSTDEWKTAKEAWKAEHPNETLKEKKLLYIKGLLDKLPWEDNVEQGYQQNAEQSNETLFNKLRKE
jgi:esterase/lipase